MYETPKPSPWRYFVWTIIPIIAFAAFSASLSIYVNWTITASMYWEKAGMDWFGTVFYHNWTFILAAILSLLVINPLPGRSDLYSIVEAFTDFRARYAEEGVAHPLISFRRRKLIWGFWQFFKWIMAYTVIASTNGIPTVGAFTQIFYMALKGVGDWGLLPRLFSLPLFPPSGEELVMLMPSMEVQYRIVYSLTRFVVTIIAVRFLLKLITSFLYEQKGLWVRNIFVILTAVMLTIIFGAPYWGMDVTTPYIYNICIILFIAFFTISIAAHMGHIGVNLSFAKRKRLLLGAISIFLIALMANASLIAGFWVNWNNNYVQYEWEPLLSKQIYLTKWAAGISDIKEIPIYQLPTGNVTKIVNKVRQWDQTAAYTKMKGQIGVNWMTLADSDIIYINGREFWVAPTTISYPSTDWISTRLIYTHASKIIIVDSHTGEFVNIKEAFRLSKDQNIYYGEEFKNNVYVNVKGFDEIGNATFSGKPDYVLSGWQRMLWFLMEGQVGFAFTPPQEEINMLYNRDVIDRVKTVLINGLTIDPDAYIVSDGERVYYAVQVLIKYPMHSGFAASSYLRYFAVVLIDVESGFMQGYVVSEPDSFLSSFYREYYSVWNNPPPDWLVPQLRYPEALLGKRLEPGQLDVDFNYHVENPFVWRSGSDFYERPESTEVHYILKTDGEITRFIGLQLVEFEVSPGKNLAGLYISYSGEKLGELDLYKVTNSTLQYIGPRVALQALETDDAVREQLTFIKNYRYGNILLYSIGGDLYYFIPIYVTTEQAGGVITKLAFIVAVDAATGTKVAMGENSASAYYTLIGGAPTGQPGVEDRLNKTMNLFLDADIGLIKPARISANVEILVANLTYTSEDRWTETSTTITSFIEEYVRAYGKMEVYYWISDGSRINFGVLLSDGSIVKLYYVSVRYL